TELASLALSPAVSDTYRIAKFKNGLNRNIHNRIAIHSFATLSEVVLAAQRAEAVENEQGARKNKSNERKMNKRNQGQWSAQGSPHSGSYTSSGSAGSERFSPYTCYHCGQQGHKRNECPKHLQKSPLSHGGPLGSYSGSAPP
ncbi:Zinc finger, CCHC-type, partial [Parasponia andersonii]